MFARLKNLAMGQIRKSEFFREFAARNYLRQLTLKELATRSAGSQESIIKMIVEGHKDLSGGCKDFCVYVHFDRDGIVDPHVFQSVFNYVAAGYSVIFVTNSDYFDNASISKLQPICHEIIHRENKGYDFGAWKLGISRIPDFQNVESLILTNDSIYGPIFPLRPIIDQMRGTGADFWGITESLEYRRHLQSYFLFFEKSVLRSLAFQRFWERFPYFKDKLCVVWNGEIGLSRSLQKAGFRMKALCPIEQLETPDLPLSGKHARIGPSGKPNPTRVFWRTLVTDFGNPFLKVDIVRDGIIDAQGEHGWRNLVASVSNYDVELIQCHSDRVRRL